MIWLISTITFLVGAVLAYLVCERRARLREMAVALAEQRAADISSQLQREHELVATLRNNVGEAQRSQSALSGQLVAANEKCEEQRKLLDDAQNKLREAFASLSSDALQRNNKAFLELANERFNALSKEASGSLDQRKAQIEGMLKPMQEMLNQYQARLGEIEKSRNEGYAALQQQLGNLNATNISLEMRTTELVSALRRPQTRGQWGELTLRRLVELAGMSNRCDFDEQLTLENETGRQRPDMVIRLPGGRNVVIDCKATLDAFLDAASASHEDHRQQCLQRHSQQVRLRVRELSGKAYWNQFERSPEFVVMFLPGEAFLYAAVEQDAGLIEESLRSRVIVATPTTLMALLKTIECGWKQQEIAANAEEIRELGGRLYDRVVIMTNHFAKLGASLENAVDHFNSTLSSLETRVLVTGRKMSELGIRGDKEIPELAPIEKPIKKLAGVGQE